METKEQPRALDMTGLRVVVEVDECPDMSYLEQEEFADVDPASLVSLIVSVQAECAACGHYETMDSLGGVDVDVNGGWHVGTFHALEDIGEDYLRDIAREMVEEYQG